MVLERCQINLSAEEKYEMITKNLEELSDGDKLKAILKDRDLKIYWGVAVTDKVDVSYFVEITKIADFLATGAEVTVLLADFHAYLDNKKTPWNLLAERAEYYENSIKWMLTSVGAPITKLKFEKGSNFQLSKEYTLDVYKLSSLVSTHDAKEAGKDIIQQVDHPLLSSLLYPNMQALDEEYLRVDAHYGSITQKRIFNFAEKYLPQLGYQKRIHLMSPIVQDLGGGKNNLEEEGKIDILDLPSTIKNKLKKAFCEKGNIINNGLLAISKHVLFPVLQTSETFIIPRSDTHGGNILFDTYKSMEEAYSNKELHPGDLKIGVETHLNKLLDPIRKAFDDPQLKKIVEKAYPGSGKKKGGTGTTPITDEIIPSRLDLRIGKIVEVQRHPEADGLYVEKIDVGEDSLRTIVSGLVNFIDIEEMQGLSVLVLCNLKPAKLRGIESKGMLLCANVAEPKQIEALTPPAGTVAGEKVFIEGYEEGEPDSILNPKKKIWEKLQVDLFTNEDCICQWQGKNLVTKSGGLLRCKTMKNAPVK